VNREGVGGWAEAAVRGRAHGSVIAH
jgi:hypothetical protein